MESTPSTILLLASMSMLPFVVATGTCYLKFSVVFSLLRNGLGLQQAPSNMVINAIALMLSAYVMYPVGADIADVWSSHDGAIKNADELFALLRESSETYRGYLAKFADVDLVKYFVGLRRGDAEASASYVVESASLFELLPAYALTEIKSAFLIGFYLYLPFVVVDLVVSGVLLSLGMMMMSPVTISAPIKLVLFVALDGWTLITKGLIEHYLPGAGI